MPQSRDIPTVSTPCQRGEHIQCARRWKRPAAPGGPYVWHQCNCACHPGSRAPERYYQVEGPASVHLFRREE
jgi:hypothetical protein